MKPIDITSCEPAAPPAREAGEPGGLRLHWYIGATGALECRWVRRGDSEPRAEIKALSPAPDQGWTLAS